MMDNKPHCIYWNELAVADEVLHVHLARYRKGQWFSLHSHSFTELIYVQEGSGMHIRPDGEEPFQQGDLLFIPDVCIHGLRAHADSGFAVINIAIAPAVADGIHYRYCDERRPWPWPNENRHAVRHLSAAEQDQFEELCSAVQHHQNDRLFVDSFLLQVLCLLQPKQQVHNIPHWLDHALQLLEEPERLVRGLDELLELTEKSREYLNRCMRKYFNMTTSDYIRKRRLAQAAHLLRHTNSSIQEIGVNCGFDNEGYFFRSFKATYDCTPRQYRQDQGISPV